ncbi:MAG: LuxR family transcriptional regulator [Bacteroidia bacterium]|nr:LuxR family transcriptional regulator [Bacteroidia bacterium]NNF31763.1 LuxR family transcriptional regulator [Flavobacteriaceae bacterium]NNK55277.1 LuxR family transcriptional regulator [Flavobacteriaceae bacterium]NNM10272.1 LuxR family transcriptional regulator [Flavobacteriaceae bacterium]
MKSLITVVLILSHAFCVAQELPPIANYPSNVYGADNQNWMISQSDDNYIYVANNKGLLEYNGARWTLYPTPNETILRSVKSIGNRIYTGCYMDFGYWEYDNKGNLNYTSLVQKQEFDMIVDEQIWNIINHDEWILFQSLNRIYLYHVIDESISFLEVENTITKLFEIENDFYFQVSNEGLFAIENKKSKLISDDAVLKENVLVNIFMRNDDMVFLTASKGFYTITNEIVQPWSVPADSVLEGLSIYSSIRLSNGDMILGTIANGIIVLTKDGEFRYQIDQSSGLGDNTALSLFEDVQENIWVGLDNGIDCVNTKAPFKNYFNRNGRLGTTYASTIHNGFLYIGTNQGLFYKTYNSNEALTLVQGTEGQVWNLRIAKGELFCGHNFGTFLISDGNAQQISNIQGAWDIREIPGEDDLLLQGGYVGLYVLERQNGSWGLRNKISGFDISSKHFEISDSGEILVSHEYKGVYRLIPNHDFTEIEEFSEITSVQKGSHSSLASFNGAIYYAYREGIFKYDETSKEFIKDESLSGIFGGDQYITGKLIADETGKLWVFTKDALIYIFAERLNNTLKTNRISIPVAQRTALDGYENIAHLDHQKYLIGTSSGYLLMDLDSRPQHFNQISINRVISGSRSGETTSMDLITEGEFPAAQNYFTFEYSSPDYNKLHTTQYQYKLAGIYDQWSSWSTNSSISFDNLPHGSYEFMVRAKGDGESNNIASYSFVINKPWYVSNIAMAIYTIAIILLFIGINSFYRRYYRKQRQRLLEENTRELKLKELATQKEIIELKNQSLNQDIESRNRELAVSTMNLIKKNSILNDIKTELENISDPSKIRNVIKVINKNLNNEDDWKFFEEAFNHADKDFFKKVKELHPDLTPNDLRFCVYLRLNLSSKEISPLLNISPRSVEIKRYRLRKKIELPRNANLNDYFISL